MSGIAGDDPRLSPQAREQAMAESCWGWAKHNLKFVHHNKLFAQWMPHFENALQLLISPDVICHALNGPDASARAEARKGDCAVYSPMVCALLEANGIDWELKIAKVPPRTDEFGHVWARAVLSDGRRIDLDASHGDYPGWRVPDRDIYGSRVYDSNGREVVDQGSMYEGLHEYIATGAGLGIAPPNEDFGSDYFNPTQEFGNFFPDTGGSSNPIDWGNILGGSIRSGFDILGKVVAPTTTYTVGPNGQVSYSTPGSAPAPTALANPLGGGSSLLWIGGGLLGLIAIVSLAGGKK
jgi:hypothetical protein